MARYKLHCFCQSGNSYKVALYLSCAGLDWEPVFVDFFKGATRDAKWRDSVNEMGEAPVLEMDGRKLTPIGRDPDLSVARRRTSSRPRARTSAWRCCAGCCSTTTSSPATSPPTASSRRSRRRRPMPNVMAFLKGRFDAAAAIVDKHLAQVEVHGRRQADHRRLLARRLRVLSGRGARLRLGQDATRTSTPGPSACSALPGWKGPYELMPGERIKPVR